MFSQDSEPVVLKRDVKAIVVPAGMEIDLSKGSLVYITQAMEICSGNKSLAARNLGISLSTLKRKLKRMQSLYLQCYRCFKNLI